MLNERLSAWCDGELSETESDHMPESFPANPEQRADCELAWLIGDALRGEPDLSDDFSARVMRALASEPVVFAPASVRMPQPKKPGPILRWMPVAAALAGITVAAWMAVSVWSKGAEVNSAEQLAVALATANKAPAKVAQFVTPLTATSGPSSAQLASVTPDRAYLMAHEASSVGAPMADVVHYIRTVSDDQQQGFSR